MEPESAYYMTELAQKLYDAFFFIKRRKNIEASRKFMGSVGGASDIARSIRDTYKLQADGKFWRNMFFFLIVIPFILLILSYVS